MATKPTTIMLADDHAVVRQGFRMILAAQWDMEVVAEVSNGREAVEKAEELQPDVCVMDVTMPELNGIEATRRLAKVSPKTRVLALSMHKDSVYVREILRAGAKGYLLKDSSETDFLNAVRAVAVGKGYLSPEVSDAVLDDYRKHVTNPIDLLSTREREVLRHLADGLRNEEIGRLLRISTDTVRSDVRRAMARLDADTRTEAVATALRQQLIS